MMMSPSASGKLTARKGINEVKDALSSTFKEMGTATHKVGVANTGGPEAQMLELKHSLRKSGKLLNTKLHVRYAYGADGIADGIMGDEQKAGLMQILSSVQKGKVDPAAAMADV